MRLAEASGLDEDDVTGIDRARVRACDREGRTAVACAVRMGEVDFPKSVKKCLGRASRRDGFGYEEKRPLPRGRGILCSIISIAPCRRRRDAMMTLSNASTNAHVGGACAALSVTEVATRPRGRTWTNRGDETRGGFYDARARRRVRRG